MESAAIAVIGRKDASRVMSRRGVMVDWSCFGAIEEERGWTLKCGGRGRVTQVKKSICGIGADPPD